MGVCVSFLGRLDSLNRQKMQSALLGYLSPVHTLSLEPPARISQKGPQSASMCPVPGEQGRNCGPHVRRRRTAFCPQIISRLRPAKRSFFYKNIRNLTQTSQTETSADTLEASWLAEPSFQQIGKSYSRSPLGCQEGQGGRQVCLFGIQNEDRTSGY